KHREGLTLLLNKQNSLILIAEYNYLVVGMVTLQEHISTAAGGTIGIVEDMVIDENFRRKGIGKMLISSIESMAIHKGYKRIQLMADNNNVSAMKFYTKQNWSRTNLIAFFKFL
ncbi:MAG: GNAT family N-acetyltransferase, partial [Spirochaetota bacterium]|nr:GNAT family N-acetyltransferase [Spirochaetota bacterium]